jgi:hypothetical protein
MPGPTTEVLNDDVKELKADIREIRGHLDSLKDDVHQVDLGLARLQTEFGLAKWLLGLTLVATASGIGTGIWWAATINASVLNMEKRFSKVEESIAKSLEQGRASSIPGPVHVPMPVPPTPTGPQALPDPIR